MTDRQAKTFVQETLKRPVVGWIDRFPVRGLRGGRRQLWALWFHRAGRKVDKKKTPLFFNRMIEAANFCRSRGLSWRTPRSSYASYLKWKLSNTSWP